MQEGRLRAAFFFDKFLRIAITLGPVDCAG